MSSPVGLLNLSALMLLLGTVGVLIVARLALAALLALGPVFIILALFRGTRGLFEGWLKTAVLFAVIPLISVLVGGGALSMLTPVVRELAAAGGTVPPRLAVTVFLGAFVHLSLSVLAFKAAASITAGWSLPFGAAEGRTSTAEAATPAAPAAAPAAMAAEATAHSASATAAAGVDGRARALAAEVGRTAPAATAAEAASSRERVVIPFPGSRADAGSQAAPAQAESGRDHRAQGLAQRFRPAAAQARPVPPREARS